MKKIIPVLVFALLLCVLTACRSTSTTSETINGITRTETVTSDGDEVVTEVVYTDEDGNVLDEEIGEAAFAAAQAGDENPLESVLNADETEEEPAEEEPAEEASAEASGEASEEEIYTAVLTCVNDTDIDIAELYIALEEDETWGYDLLDEILAAGEEAELDYTVTYAPDTAFEMDFVTADGEDHTVGVFDFSGLDDPENITITFTSDADGYVATLS